MSSIYAPNCEEIAVWRSPYHSTRSRTSELSSKQAIRRGIAPDGGLYVSDALGEATINLASLASKDYFELAREVLGALLPDYSADEIAACVCRGLRGHLCQRRSHPHGAARAGSQRRWRALLRPRALTGPTSAFKDVALQMLPRLMARTADFAAEDAPAEITIVTATSGDTGKAALAGFADAPGVGITVFYPEGRSPHVQELQGWIRKRAATHCLRGARQLR